MSDQMRQDEREQRCAHLDASGVDDATQTPVDGCSRRRRRSGLLATRHISAHDHDARQACREGMQVGGGGDAAGAAQQDDAAGAGLHHPAGEEQSEAAAAARDDVGRRGVQCQTLHLPTWPQRSCHGRYGSTDIMLFLVPADAPRQSVSKHSNHLGPRTQSQSHGYRVQLNDLVHSAHHFGGVAVPACAGCIAQHRSAPAAVAHRQAIWLWANIPPAGASSKSVCVPTCC